MADLLKKLLPFQSEFSHRYACWANNHNGWSKMKKQNRKLAKTREKREVDRQIEDGLDEYVNQKGIDVESEWYTNCTTCTVPCIFSHIRGEKVYVWCLQRGCWGAHIGCEFYKRGPKRGIPFESNEVRHGERRNVVEVNEDFWDKLWRNENGTN